MKKILIVQRNLTHYRKLLLEYVSGNNEYDVYVLCFGNENKTIGHIITVSAKSLVNYKKSKIMYSKDMVNYIKDNYQSYDYIILEGATNIANNIPICRFLKKVKKPYIVWDAGRRKNSKMTLARKCAQALLEFVWKNAAAIIAYSTLAKKYFTDIGISPDKIFVCQNTLNVGSFDRQLGRLTEGDISEIKEKYAPNGEKIVLYVGAVEQRKRIKDLIDAFETVKASQNAVLIIIGGGAQFEELKSYTADKDGIYMTGSIIDGVIKYFAAADVFALPSEGGLSLNQAMICGKPLIASSADGTELDLIEDGKNGYLFEETNVGELAEKITAVLSDEELCKKMGEHSRRIIDERVNEKCFYANLKKCLNSVDSNKN